MVFAVWLIDISTVIQQ